MCPKPFPAIPIEPIPPDLLQKRIQHQVHTALLNAFPHLADVAEPPEWFRPGQFDLYRPSVPRHVQRVVRKEGRPAVVVKNDIPHTSAGNSWQAPLQQTHLLPAIQATGRISLLNESQSCRGAVGTGWLVAKDIVVTNRHVAKCFAFGNQPPFRFRPDLSLFDTVRVEIDFKAELGSPNTQIFPVVEVLDIAPEGEPDLAFLRLSNPDQLPMPEPVLLASDLQHVEANRLIAAIGYPGKPAGDLQPDEMDVIEAIFTGYGIKTVSPGEITDLEPDGIFVHDCSTLKGNSGSMIVDLADGLALGIHFHGEFLTANKAIAFPAIQQRLQSLGL